MLQRNPSTRRAFLRGAGATIIGLPLCEELMGTQAFAQNAGELYNYITCFFGLGCPTELQDLSLPEMAPLRGYQENGRLTHFMASYPDYVGEGGGNHERMLPHLTIAQRPFQADRIAGGPSLDYFLYSQTDAKPDLDIFSCGNTVLNINDQVEFNRSYRGSNRSVTPTRNPMDFYRELFGPNPSQGAETKTKNDLIVDSVVESYRYMMSPAAGLSGQARSVVSDTLDEVAQLQRRIEVTIQEFPDFYASLDKTGWAQGVPGAVISNDAVNDYRERRGQGDNHDRAWVVPLLAEIIVLGLKLGRMRFGSYALTAGAERARFGQYANRDVHEHYHSNRSGAVSDQVKWYVANFVSESAYLLRRLDEERLEDGRTLLDATGVLVCTEMERHHEREDLFWALVGGPFRHQPGRIGRPGQNGTDTNLYNTIAHGILAKEMPSGYDPAQEHIFGDAAGFTGLTSSLLP